MWDGVRRPLGAFQARGRFAMQDQSTIVVGNILAAAALGVNGLGVSAGSDDRAQRRDSSADGSGEADDIELMGRVARGDADAQRQVVRRLLRRVEGLCWAVLRRSEEALDARQLSIVEILKSAHGFRGASTLERWADRITVRTALRAAASERRARRAPVDVELDAAHPTSESVLLARQYLDGISERQRMVVVLRHGLEYSIEEIAEVTGISQNAVKDRLLRGRAIMRRMCRRDQLLMEVSSGKVAG
jgi:RNA polymerase sigma-70 factor, ECF subfamily